VTYNALLREIMTDMRALLDTPDKWCKEAYARDSGGNETKWNDANAQSFCVHGAFNLVKDRFQQPTFQDAQMNRSQSWIFADVWELLVKFRLTPWHNDRTSDHAELMGRFDAGIAAIHD